MLYLDSFLNIVEKQGNSFYVNLSDAGLTQQQIQAVRQFIDVEYDLNRLDPLMRDAFKAISPFRIGSDVAIEIWPFWIRHFELREALVEVMCRETNPRIVPLDTSYASLPEQAE